MFKIWGSVWARVFDNRLPIWLATKLQPKLKGYDLAVAFRQEAPKKVLSSGFVRVLTHCVDAKRKFAWIHYDALKINNDNDFFVIQKVITIICFAFKVGIENFKRFDNRP